MKLTMIAGAFAVLGLAAAPKTTQDGVYTDAQARRGETIYGKACASCHGQTLEGDGQAPSLAGPEFDSEWKDQPLGDLFERIRGTMPADAPGTLQPPEVADVLAFLLSKEKMPAGASELPADASTLKSITFVLATPESPSSQSPNP